MQLQRQIEHTKPEVTSRDTDGENKEQTFDFGAKTDTDDPNAWFVDPRTGVRGQHATYSGPGPGELYAGMVEKPEFEQKPFTEAPLNTSVLLPNDYFGSPAGEIAVGHSTVQNSLPHIRTH
ncbi:hypothetical protein ApAK_02930 [Thermoplasmatales archaeon AK]|nr:hypothetical protein [Thermoplasmatales archaeon AK]